MIKMQVIGNLGKDCVVNKVNGVQRHSRPLQLFPGCLNDSMALVSGTLKF